MIENNNSFTGIHKWGSVYLICDNSLMSIYSTEVTFVLFRVKQSIITMRYKLDKSKYNFYIL